MAKKETLAETIVGYICSVFVIGVVVFFLIVISCGLAKMGKSDIEEGRIVVTQEEYERVCGHTPGPDIVTVEKLDKMRAVKARKKSGGRDG